MPTVRTDDEVWKYLNVQRDPGESMNDVLRRELGLDESVPDIDTEIAALDLGEGKEGALRAMWKFVRDQGETTPKEMKEAIFDEYPATYQKSGPDYWHRQLAPYLEELPGVVRPSQRKWLASESYDGKEQK